MQSVAITYKLKAVTKHEDFVMHCSEATTPTYGWRILEWHA